MAIDFYPEDRSPADGKSTSTTSSTSREPGCCDYNDRHHCLTLTQLDGTTEGFPLTWIYRWQWRKDASQEEVILTLTEHQITVRGRNLTPILDHLSANIGFHLRIKADRYLKLQGPRVTLIYEITTQNLTRNQAPPIN